VPNAPDGKKHEEKTEYCPENEIKGASELNERRGKKYRPQRGEEKKQSSPYLGSERLEKLLPPFLFFLNFNYFALMHYESPFGSFLWTRDFPVIYYFPALIDSAQSQTSQQAGLFGGKSPYIKENNSIASFEAKFKKPELLSRNCHWKHLLLFLMYLSFYKKIIK